MYSAQSQKLRKTQQPKTIREVKQDSKIVIRKAKKNRRNLWIVREDI